MLSNILENSASPSLKSLIATKCVYQNYSDLGIDIDTFKRLVNKWVENMKSNEPFDSESSIKRDLLHVWFINQMSLDCRLNRIKNCKRFKDCDNRKDVLKNAYSNAALIDIEKHLSSNELEADLFSINKIKYLPFIIAMLLSAFLLFIDNYRINKKDALNMDIIEEKINTDIRMCVLNRYIPKCHIKDKIRLFSGKFRCRLTLYYNILNSINYIIRYSLGLVEEIIIRLRIISNKYLVDKIIYSSIK